ncbi:hypothetical protein HYW20_04305 [Candidatus Woesearchaeota archaeon]|nr:hypothetical protein [Candidatus Woesearchaeota archaeon]
MDPEKKSNFGKKISEKISVEKIFIGLALLLGIAVIINIILTSSISNELKNGKAAVKESIKPAKIELTVIRNSKCTDCFDISTVVGHIKSINLNITKETALEFDSNEARQIMSKYKIEKIPAIIVTGEIDKASIQGLEKKTDALLLADILPPYTNATTGDIRGRVALHLLKDTECAKCNDLVNLMTQIKAAGVMISEEKDIASNSDEGKDLIKKYNIGFAPTIILSNDASVYDIIQKAWPQIGTQETDGSYVLRTVAPPFVNLTTGELKGIVNLVYLTDKSCTDCYDVSQHREILASPQSFAITLDKEDTFDISDAKGKDLLKKYNITQVPTIIVSSEVGVYPSSLILKQFFSVEKDGSYVFRKLSSVGSYKDLTANEVVKAPQQQALQNE